MTFLALPCLIAFVIASLTIAAASSMRGPVKSSPIPRSLVRTSTAPDFDTRAAVAFSISASVVPLAASTLRFITASRTSRFACARTSAATSNALRTSSGIPPFVAAPLITIFAQARYCSTVSWRSAAMRLRSASIALRFMRSRRSRRRTHTTATSATARTSSTMRNRWREISRTYAALYVESLTSFISSGEEVRTLTDSTSPNVLPSLFTVWTSSSHIPRTVASGPSAASSTAFLSTAGPSTRTSTDPPTRTTIAPSSETAQRPFTSTSLNCWSMKARSRLTMSRPLGATISGSGAGTGDGGARTVQSASPYTTTPRSRSGNALTRTRSPTRGDLGPLETTFMPRPSEQT